MEYTKGEWKARKLLPDNHGIITKEAWEIATPEYDVVAQIIGSAPIRKEADANLMASAPIGDKLAQAVLGANFDDYGDFLELQKLAKKFKAKADGKG